MYKGKYFIRERVYICGDYMDADIYPVFQPPGKRRSRCKPTSRIQAQLNQRNAEKKLARLVHTNFTERDLALHLTYRENPESAESAQKDLTNFIRRVKRRYAKLGIEFKYISCTEYGQRRGRVHHHLIISGGIDRDELEKLWGFGFANSKRLQFENDGITRLAHYAAKGHVFFKRWNQSRNLRQPVPLVCDSSITQRDITDMVKAIENKTAWGYFAVKYRGFELTDAVIALNEVNRNTYIHVDMVKKKSSCTQEENNLVQELIPKRNVPVKYIVSIP